MLPASAGVKRRAIWPCRSGLLLLPFFFLTTAASTADAGSLPGLLDALLRRNDTIGRGFPYAPHTPNEPWSDVDCKELACNGKDADCADWPDRVCATFAACKNPVCLHKELWPMLGQDAFSFVAIFVVAVLAGCAGIGGGGINVPILMLLSRFDIKEAVPLSHVAVMGNALSQLFINTRQSHPSVPHRPLIHYEMALLLLPAMLGGSSIGVVVGRVFPPTLLVILSLVLLLLATTKTMAKGWHAMQEAREARKARQIKGEAQQRAVATPQPLPARVLSARSISAADGRSPAAASGVSLPLVGADVGPRGNGAAATTPTGAGMRRSWSGNFRVTLPGDEELAATCPDLDNASQVSVRMRVPLKVIGLMIAFNIATCADFLGMSKDVFHVQTCSTPYWIFLFGLYPFIIGAIVLSVRHLRFLRRWHDQRGDGEIPGDPEINGKTVMLFPTLAAAVGLLAGLLGLGGGEFMVPLLLEFGLLPRMASATSGFLIFFSTSSDIVHYAITGTLQPFLGYAVAYFFLAMFGAMLGLVARDSRYARDHSYMVVFLLAGLLIFSGALLAIRGLFSGSLDWSFGSFCGSS